MKSAFSLVSLLVSNLLFLILILTQPIGIVSILFVYWAQSCIIGIFHLAKMMGATNAFVRFKNIESEEVKEIPATHNQKVFYSLFFALHYGVFHLAYFFFIGMFPIIITLMTMGSGVPFDLIGEYVSLFNPLLWVAIVLFFINHYFSFKQNFDPDEKVTFPNFMFIPYARIIPMHVVILVGTASIMNGSSPMGMLVLFVLLKTIADTIMHLFEHRKEFVLEKKNMVVVIMLFVIIFALVILFVPNTNEQNYQKTEALEPKINACFSSQDSIDCFANLSIEYNDYNLCKKVGTMMDYINNPSGAEGLCYLRIATLTKDETVCDLIVSVSTKNNCRCDFIVSTEEKKQCYENIYN